MAAKRSLFFDAWARIGPPVRWLGRTTGTVVGPAASAIYSTTEKPLAAIMRQPKAKPLRPIPTIVNNASRNRRLFCPQRTPYLSLNHGAIGLLRSFNEENQG